MVFGLCDANNFYCSCERAFDPKLKNVPIVVLSNNDGCVIARSQESKDLGIKMGDPWFKIEAWAKDKGVRQFSSNYTLYGDMSRRLYAVLGRFAPRVEPYSIDEMFLDLAGLPGDVAQHCQQARATIRQETKIPTCIGIGATKTQAKLANFAAKKMPAFNGVCDLRDETIQAALYSQIPVGEVWGIGGASAKKLQALGIDTVEDLTRIELRQARKVLTVTGARVVMELRGQSCLPLSLMGPPRKGLAVTRTFGLAITEWETLAEAVATYATRAAEKLRQHGMLAGHMTVFIQTNRFIEDGFYSNMESFRIEPTQDTLALIESALWGTRRIWIDGFRYWKAGVILDDLSDAASATRSLFPGRDWEKSSRLMTAMDRLNGRYGRGTVRAAVAGFERSWAARADYLSQRYTTHLHELMRVMA